MNNVALAAKKALEKIQLIQRKEALIARLVLDDKYHKRLSSISSTIPISNFFMDPNSTYRTWQEYCPWDVIKRPDTAINLFIETIVEELGDLDFTTNDEYFYYLCDFPKHCENLGIKFPDQFKVGRYTKTLENYDG